MCFFALTATVATSKYFKSDEHSFDSSDWAGGEISDGWDEEDWPSEPLKPIKAWQEPIVVEKKVPVYVPGMSCCFVF